MSEERWFKVLVDGRSCHGGDLVWSLPTDNGDGTFTPGAWHTVAPGRVRLCEYGFHLTTDPTQWLAVGCEAYLAEGDQSGERDHDKQVFARARLLAPTPEAIPDYWRRVNAFIQNDLPQWGFRKPSARGAAWEAAWGAARDAAWVAAREVAREAAWVAARGAAWDAAWEAAREVAWEAAREVAREAAIYCLVESICADLPIAEEHRQFARSLRNHYVKED